MTLNIMKEDVIVMDNIFNILYNLYTEVLYDLNIGHPLSQEKIDRMWKIIHDLYFVQNNFGSPEKVNYLLEYYEYL